MTQLQELIEVFYSIPKEYYYDRSEVYYRIKEIDPDWEPV